MGGSTGGGRVYWRWEGGREVEGERRRWEGEGERGKVRGRVEYTCQLVHKEKKIGRAHV